MSILKKLFLPTLIFSFLASPVSAGGGNYGAYIKQKGIAEHVPFIVEMTVFDLGVDSAQAEYKDQFGIPVVVNEEFKVIAHKEDEGDRCEPATGKTGTNGKFTVTCYSNQKGRLTFHLEPIGRTDLGNSHEINLDFAPEYAYGPTEAPMPTAVPTATYSPKPTSKPTLIPTITSTVVEATPSPSIEPSVSPTPIPGDDEGQKSSSLYLILLLSIPVLAAGGFFAYKKFAKAKLVYKPEFEMDQSNPPKMDTSEDTSNFKTDSSSKAKKEDE